MKRPKKLTRRWLERWADRMAAQANVENPYWFIHNAGNACGTFCFDCGEKRRLELREKFKDDPDTLRLLERLDGGWSYESDGCEHCETCGQLLAYSLTNSGAESEWEHFLENGIDLDSSDVGYHVQAILEHGMKLVGLAQVKLRGRLS